jgi:hypothetical protein
MKQLFFLLLVGFVLSSCSGKSNPVNSEPKPPSTKDFTPKQEAVQVTQSQTNSVQDLSPGSILFSSLPHGIKPGSIIYSDGYSSKAPKGFLRKVNSISGNSVSTSQASLEDAFSKADFGFVINPSSMKKVNSGSVRVGSTSSTNVIYNLDYLVYDVDKNASTTDDQIRIQGSISIDGSITGKVKFPPFNMSADFGINSVLDLNLVATGELNYSSEKTLFTAEGAPVIVSGIVITPEVSLVFLPEISVKGKASAGIRDNVAFTSSVSYDAVWKNTNSLVNSFSAKPVQVEVNGELKGTLFFKFTVYLYEVVGPGVEIGPYARLSVDINQNPWWKLYAGAHGKLVINSRGIASSIGDYSFDLFNAEKLVSQSQGDFPFLNHPPSLSNFFPPNGSSGMSGDVNLSWSGSDQDGDHLTYSLIWGVGTNSPERVDGLVENHYTLEDLPAGSSVFWKVIAFDKSDSTAGPINSFTTAASSVSYAPVNPSPANGSSGIVLPVNLTWECNDPSTPLTYDLYFGTDTTNMFIRSGLAQNSYTLDIGAPQGTKEYWKVSVRDFRGNKFDGPCWSFIVGDADGDSGGNDTLVIQPGTSDGQDVWIKHVIWSDGHETYSAYPDHDSLTVEYDNPSWLQESESLIRFDLSGIQAGSKIVLAQLNLYGLVGNNSSTDMPVISFGRAEAAWDEQTVTWLTKPGCSNTLDYTSSTNYGGFRWHKIDVTSIVQEWVNGSSNYGFVLMTSQNECRSWFFSSDVPDVSKHPVLIVVYQK